MDGLQFRQVTQKLSLDMSQDQDQDDPTWNRRSRHQAPGAWNYSRGQCRKQHKGQISDKHTSAIRRNRMERSDRGGGWR